MASTSVSPCEAGNGEELIAHPRGKSSIWTHFGFKAKDGSVSNWKKVFCRACDREIPYSGNTSNLSYHLSKFHPELMAEVNKEKKRNEADGKAEATTRQKSLKQFMALNPLQHSSARYKELVDAVTDFICIDMQPISVVDGYGFRKLMHTAEPRFQIPSRNYFSSKEIPVRYNQQAEYLKSQLSHPTCFNITTDIWSSQHQNRSYISLTCHYVTRDFHIMSRCLEAVEVPGSHDAESLSGVIQEGLARWNIESRVFYATTDNGGNIKNACTEYLNLTHIPCIGHTLQLGVKRCFDVRKVSIVLARCRKLVGFFHRSYKVTYALREKQQQLKIKQHKLIQDCVTRWGSTLSMIERILEQQTAICAVLMENRSDRSLLPTSEEFTVLEELASVLKPIQQATELLSGSKYATVSCMFPVLKQLLQHSLKPKEDDSSVMKSIKESVAQDLITRYQDTEVDTLLKIAAFLDPRFKEQPYLTDSEQTTVILKAREKLTMLIEQVNEKTSNMETQDSVVVIDEALPPTKKGRVSALLGDLFKDDGAHPTTRTAEEISRAEVQRYCAEDKLDLDKNPLEWWKQRKIQFPYLIQLIREIFCITATSCPSERLFSAAGNLITQKRNCLLPQNVNRMLFCMKT